MTGRGRHIVAVVVTDVPTKDANPPRHWIVTAYIAAGLPGGVVTWEQG